MLTSFSPKIRHSTSVTCLWPVLLGVLAAWTFWSPVRSMACETPVYRYAMYKWYPSRYAIFYLYRGQEDPQDQAVHEAIDELSENYDRQVNVFLEKLDLTDEEKLKFYPEHIREAWTKLTDDELPRHVVITPHRVPLDVGRLDTESLKMLIDSPARRKVAELLGEGYRGVFVFIPGNKEERESTATAYAELLETIETASEEFAFLEDPYGEEEEDQPIDRRKFQVGLLTISPHDVKERFFVEQLRNVWELKPEDEGKPMTWAIYGRGRAHLPLIGKGIVSDNLFGDIGFINGACSCEIKDMNPGMDLLTAWDWETTAEDLSDKFGDFMADRFMLERALVGKADSEDDPETAEESATELVDTTFLCRATLATIGRNPTAKEYEDYMEDSSEARRDDALDRLLDRPEFAEHWFVVFGDELRDRYEADGKSSLAMLSKESLEKEESYAEMIERMLSDERIPQVVASVDPAAGSAEGESAESAVLAKREELNEKARQASEIASDEDRTENGAAATSGSDELASSTFTGRMMSTLVLGFGGVLVVMVIVSLLFLRRG